MGETFPTQLGPLFTLTSCTFVSCFCIMIMYSIIIIIIIGEKILNQKNYSIGEKGTQKNVYSGIG